MAIPGFQEFLSPVMALTRDESRFSDLCPILLRLSKASSAVIDESPLWS